MLKSIFKQLLGLTLLVMLVFSLSIPAYATGEITGNNTFETAYAAGNWKYSNMSTTILPANKTEAY